MWTAKGVLNCPCQSTRGGGGQGDGPCGLLEVLNPFFWLKIFKNHNSLFFNNLWTSLQSTWLERGVRQKSMLGKSLPLKKRTSIYNQLLPLNYFWTFPIDTGEDLTTSSTTATSTASSKRRRSSLAQLTELLKLKEWGIWDKDKYRDRGNLSRQFLKC